MKYHVKTKDRDSRLDKFLCGKMADSRSQIQKLIKNGGVLVNGKIQTPHYFLREGETVSVVRATLGSPHHESPSSVPGLLPVFKLQILAQTPDYIVIAKPAGIPVHPDSKYKKGTLIQIVAKKFPKIKTIGDNTDRPGVVQRLDKDVSGLMVIALTKPMFNHLKKQFAEKEINKEYIALVKGQLPIEQGVIDFPIARSEAGKMVARSKKQAGKEAITEYDTLQKFINYTLVKAVIKTGRSHQIRVHFQSLGHPVVGDTLHKIKKQKAEKFPLPRLFLHAEKLGFYDLAGKLQEFHSELPKELEDYLKKLK